MRAGQGYLKPPCSRSNLNTTPPKTPLARTQLQKDASGSQVLRTYLLPFVQVAWAYRQWQVTSALSSVQTCGLQPGTRPLPAPLTTVVGKGHCVPSAVPGLPGRMQDLFFGGESGPVDGCHGRCVLLLFGVVHARFRFPQDRFGTWSTCRVDDHPPHQPPATLA